ncbi:UNVERIFIED_CONTAM: hypothetical protein RMT77_009793 [Armadillidium vulgare]
MKIFYGLALWSACLLSLSAAATTNFDEDTNVLFSDDVEQNGSIFEEGFEEDVIDDAVIEVIEDNREPRNSRGCIARVRNDTTINGECMDRRACARTGGQNSGRCGPRKNVCCLKEKRCSQSTALNNTIFLNLEFPEADRGTGACTLTINRINANICQMRFEFLTLELSQPDSDGNCVTDFLTVTGGTYESPTICGSNTGQHMYVDVDPQGGAVRLTVDRTAASMSDRMWKVQVTQIECTSKFKAPAGCLQYYTETSGTVSTFNFDQNIDETSVPQATRQIVNMNYAVCVQIADGYCSIMWTRNITGGDFGFTVSSNVAGISRDLIGDPVSSSISGVCRTDFVVIPGAVDDLGNQNDRFCGAGFPNYVISNLRPFIMYVSTNDNEMEDVLNRGFRLDYRQMIC